MDKLIGIDADSLLYKACYRSQLVNTKKNGCDYTDKEREDSLDLEMAYFEFCGIIAGIRTAVDKKFWEENAETEKLTVTFDIVFSPKKTFRHDIYPAYKANRKPSNIFGLSELKKLVRSRLDTIEIDNVEADDIVMHYELIACIDKDIINHSPVPCFNYSKWEWSEGLDQETIERNYYYQALLGDSTDNIKGAKRIGKKGANDAVYDMLEPIEESFETFFQSREEAEMNMRLVRMDQWSPEKGVVLWTLD